MGIPEDKCWYYVVDEPGKITDSMLKQYKLLKRAYPKANIFQNIGCVSPRDSRIKMLNEFVDVWMPHLNNVFPGDKRREERLNFFKSLGKPVWTYQCATGTPAALNYYRLYPWKTWKMDLQGMMIWVWARWVKFKNWSKDKSKPWGEIDSWDLVKKCEWSHYENQGVVYTGRYMGDLVGSIRLEAFREGLNDYLYLYELKRLLSSSRLDDKSRRYFDDLMKSTVEKTLANSNDAGVVQRNSSSLLDAILKLKKMKTTKNNKEINK
jgi:hypothetical protein